MNRTSRIIIAGIIGLFIGGGLWWGISHFNKRNIRPPVQQKVKKSNDPLQPALDAYNKGKFKDAEANAVKVIQTKAKSEDPKERKQAVRARYILAFSAARRKDMKLAQERFAVLKNEAAKLPDRGKQDPKPGTVSPTLEEEGAYQHAVCTAALGDKKAAEAEYIAFIKQYPESPLIHGAAKRIEMLHDGKMPEYAEKAWQEAVKTAQVKEKERKKAQLLEQSQCGPECLAKLLEKCGTRVDADTLTKEMKTDINGTSLFAMIETAKKHGHPAKGVALTYKGLLKQSTPMITLLIPGHYVVVESISPKEVKLWDPFAKGPGNPGSVTLQMKDWMRMWAGVAMVLEVKDKNKNR